MILAEKQGEEGSEKVERLKEFQSLSEICPDNCIVGAFAYGRAGNLYRK
jgi:hypothetical protein